jgi:radical SAM superfamily enzyme YgiQ (UPF0313 family)
MDKRLAPVVPADMAIAPALGPIRADRPIQPLTALLLNPFSPPADPLPHVVGITVHLTFARRAYELASWYRAQGSIVVLGGLHVLSCPEEALAHADTIAIGDGVQLWPTILDDIERWIRRPAAPCRATHS